METYERHENSPLHNRPAAKILVAEPAPLNPHDLGAAMNQYGAGLSNRQSRIAALNLRIEQRKMIAEAYDPTPPEPPEPAPET